MPAAVASKLGVQRRPKISRGTTTKRPSTTVGDGVKKSSFAEEDQPSTWTGVDAPDWGSWSVKDWYQIFFTDPVGNMLPAAHTSSVLATVK